MSGNRKACCTCRFRPGVFTITGSTLTVRLSNLADEYVIADAVRVERIGDLPQGPEVQVLDGSTDIPDNTGSVSLGATAPGSPVSKIFTVRNLGVADLPPSISSSKPAGPLFGGPVLPIRDLQRRYAAWALAQTAESQNELLWARLEALGVLG